MPKGTSLFDYIQINQEFFSVYSTYVYTEQMHYPTKQLELLELHRRVGDTEYAVAVTHWLEGFLDWGKPCTKDFLLATPPCVSPVSTACKACDTSSEQWIEDLWSEVTTAGVEEETCCLPAETICFPYVRNETSSDWLEFREDECRNTYCRTAFAEACQMLSTVGDSSIGSARYGEFYNGKMRQRQPLDKGQVRSEVDLSVHRAGVEGHHVCQ